MLIAISSISVAFAGNSEADYEKELLESEGGQLATEIIDRLNTSVYRGNSNEQMVSEFIKKYFDELYVVEVKIANEMAKEESDRTLMDNYLEQKRQIFNRYWLQDDPQTVYYYYPISWSGTPSHDWSKVENVSIFETGDEVKPQYLMSYTYEGITYVFSLIYHNNELKIQDFFFKIS
ncbi:hypothetical protein [Psychrobacter lutiphocae]|uniref:hypothetical protein n=1 Tax=Psychrobacter lutiphocae TaxID=540500 RepID=UPI0012E9B7F3|nr:hypothetical protein [Psychrobacter lutiphocae]